MARVSQYPDKRDQIVQHIGRRNGPSLREIAVEARLPLGTLHDYVRRLAGEGLVEWTPRAQRTLRLTDAGRQLVDRRRPSLGASVS